MFLQYPEKTEYIYSYVESRGGQYDEIVNFGIQAFIKAYLLNPITIDDINEADELITAHGEPFNRKGWEYILNTYNGYLPLKITSVPEGTVLKYRNVMATVVNTDPKCAWLTTYIETPLLRAIWYPTTIATNGRAIKKLLTKYLTKTGGIEGIDFKLHDFGARGTSSLESATIGAMAHLVNFKGTDTIAGLIGARRFYNEAMAGFSVPASEHSTITSWGRSNEVKAYRNMIKKFGKPGAIFSVVSDSYDIYNAVENIWGTELINEVRACGATLVIRPDSGDPVDVVTNIVKLIDKKFGSEVNKQGYKLLNNVRVLQGDGITIDTIDAILNSVTNNGFSADNIVFGQGGALLQGPQRDDQEFAMKASAAFIHSEWVNVYKDPVTAPNKKSKKGKLGLINTPDGYKTVSEEEAGDDNILQTVYKNGNLYNETTFSEVRERALV
jgi:nicotinamide phosphoribosyltransferase